MKKRLHILHLEDNANDGELVHSLLEGAGIDCEIRRVDSEPEFKASLDAGTFDLIISDYTIPSFDGLAALRIARKKSPHVPFIFVSATIGEDVAIDSLLGGATDYVLKQKMSRLVPAVIRALREADERMELKKAEEALRKSESNLRRAQQIGKIGSWFVDIGKNTLEWSEETYRIFGRNPSTFTPTNEAFFAALHPEDRDAVVAASAESIRTGKRYQIAHRIILPDGTERFVSEQAEMILDEHAKPVGMLGVVQDITERWRAEEEVRLRTENFRQLFEKAPVGIVLLDKADRIVDANKAFQSMFQYSLEELRGQVLNELIVPDHLRSEGEEMSRGPQLGQTVARETKRRRKDGASLDVTVLGYPILIDEKNVGICGIYVDESERKRLESQVLRTQRLESIGTLAAGIAHDLNNVLGPILLAVQTFRNKATDAQSREILQLLEMNVHRGASIIKQVLSFARGTGGERANVDLAKLIKDTGSIIQQTFPRSIEITIKTQENLGSVYADPTQISQVLMNLCVNARDAMPKGGRLSITAASVIIDQQYARMTRSSTTGPCVAITVSDTGTGISHENQEKIFDPFFTTKEMGKGTGLGLATSMGIVKGHGGFITVYSEPGRGTEFKVYIPAVPVMTSKPPERENHELPSGDGEWILVVDDEAAIREIIKTTLESYGYRVLVATNGFEGLTRFTEHQEDIALVVTDVVMPMMDGPSAMATMKKQKPDVRIITISGIADPSRDGSLIDAGANRILHKPFTAEELLETVNEVLHSSRT